MKTIYTGKFSATLVNGQQLNNVSGKIYTDDNTLYCRYITKRGECLSYELPIKTWQKGK